MNEGAWINSITGQSEWIDEHARYMQRGGPALEKLGLPQSVWDSMQEYRADFSGPGREAICILAMGAGFIRMRGHGNSWTFEYTISSKRALPVIKTFLEKYAGPLTFMSIHNLATKEVTEMNYTNFMELMSEDYGDERIMRVAKKTLMYFKSNLLH